MNQYPGFVPMVVPQPYMVAMPTAIPMSGAVGPGLPALPQGLHPQVAAAHVAGAPVVTSSVVTAPGMASAVRAAQLSQGVGQLPQGMGQLAAQGMGHLAAQGMGQHLGMAGMPGMGQAPHQGPMALPTAKVVPQALAGAIDSRKRPWGSGDMDKGKGGRFDNRWQSNPEQDVEESNIDDSVCVLDHFNSDLNLVIDPDGCGAQVMLDPPGFCFTWAGARATYGVCKGKVYYEVHILEHLPVDFGDDHQEMDPHVVRVGWSIDSSSFQLGEEPWSFGYGGTGKFSTNCRFSDYGQRFGAGDVIGAMLDLDSRPASISFTKNGTWYGVAIPLHGFPVGSKDMALYPHILSKNCKVKVNFGQMDAWFPPPQGFAYIGQLPLSDRVRGMKSPERKADCEMIMIIGLPGVGKTTWGINMQKSHPEKRYNIIGTDTLIDKMRVMGLPRKRNYHGRWEVLIEKATKCLNKLFEVGSRRKRNYILDQTNVYASARRRKMKNFRGFYRVGAVLQPEDPEMERRSRKRTVEDGKVVPESAVMEMKANFSVPEERDNLFDRIDFIELPRDKVVALVEQYVREGQEKRPPREEVFRHDSRFQKKNDTPGYGQQGPRPGQPQSVYGQRPMLGGPGPKQQPPMKDSAWLGQGDGLLGRAPNQLDESASKRLKLDRGGNQGGALDLLKQQYDEDPQDSSQWGAGGVTQAAELMGGMKEEPHWAPQDTPPAMAVGGGAMGVHHAPSPLPPHLAQQGGALVVSPHHPSGTFPLTTQPPPPPPPMHLAHTAAGPAFVALTPLPPPPGPPPPGAAIVAVGGAGGVLGAAPPGGFHAQLQAIEGGGQWHQGAMVPHSWQQSDSHTPTTNTPTQSAADSSASRRQWGQQVGGEGLQGVWQQQQQQQQQQQAWPDRAADGLQKGQAAWQRGSGSQGWQSQDTAPESSDTKGGQQPAWQAGAGNQQQPWQSQDRSDRGQKGWPASHSSSEERGNSWHQGQGSGVGGRSYEESRDRYGGGGNQRDMSRHGSYDSKNQGYGESSGRRFDDFSRPPPDARGGGGGGGRLDDFHGGDSRGGRFGGGGGSGQFGESGGNDRWSSGQRGNERWSSGPSSHQDRHGPPDSGDNSRWSGGGGRDQGERWGSRGQDRFSGGRDHDRGGRDLDRGRDRDRGDRDRERDRDRGGDRDRDRGSDRDRSGRDHRDRDQDRDSYRDSYRDRERDRGSRDRDHDSGEPRQRRRKSKWDNPDDEGGSKADPGFPQSAVKEEPVMPGYGDHGPPGFGAGQQPYSQFPPQQGEGADSHAAFPPRGINFNKPPPASSAGGPSPANFSPKDRPSDLPSLLDVQFGNRPPPPPAATTTTAGGSRERPADTPKSSSGETSLLGPVPSAPPARFQGSTGGGSGGPSTASQSGPMPNTSVPPPRGGPPPPPFGDSGPGPGGNRPPFQPGAGPRFTGPNAPETGGGGQRPGFRMDGPPRPMRPRNPQNFSGPPGNMGQMGGPPPNAPWNQNRFGGGRGMPPRPRFDGPGGPGGRFPGGPGPMRWPRGPR
ncbi:uncharacterized protein LOC143289849 [Babylonia areolata]|uniref:uncharacterized protein LOC143289849 n=1 Tax=Babylonia areolata TaxID=304850 RepID=UPI003FD2EDF8